MDGDVGLGKTCFVLAMAGMMLAIVVTHSSASASKRCFGKEVNRVTGPGQLRTKMKAGDVLWLRAGVRVRAKAFTRICAGKGRQVVWAGKGRAWVSTGAGDDVIRLQESSNRNRVEAGAGDDRAFGAKGHDTLVGGPGADEIRGAGGNDRITDTSGVGNLLFGEEGSDRISSLGSAVSELHGGNGSDFMYSNGGVSPSGKLEQLFGEKGNDHLNADRPNNLGPAYLDGGEGDDWMNGTPKDDVAIFNSGIKKIRMGKGDDLMVGSGRGRTSVEGGSGSDTISYEALMPASNPFRWNVGVKVRLAAGYSQGFSRYELAGIENVIGSSFSDEISGVAGQRNEIHGGLGDDVLVGDDFARIVEPGTDLTQDMADGDVVDGGLGSDACIGFAVVKSCFENTPDEVGDHVVVSIEEGGILTVLGTPSIDTISIGYDQKADQYIVSVAAGAVPAGLCTPSNPAATVIKCPADINRLTGMMVYGGLGDDRIKLETTIPANLTTTLDGGAGKNFIQGGPSKDFISTEAINDRSGRVTGDGSAGSILRGGGNLDVIYANDAVTVDGGPGPDGLRVTNPCLGARLQGGDDPDSVVFAGAGSGVKANLAKGHAEWRTRACPSRTEIAGDVEKLEGTAFDDWLILGKRLPRQQGKSTLLGREGLNVLDAKNGDKNTITTGPEKRSNTVKADAGDKIVWGWGLASF
ncbi:MAG: hypothetical protein JJE13_08420 [Thermoleophilia bacterium]|nr:hypothetical protein [Thermoleophilia bacterium]